MPRRLPELQWLRMGLPPLEILTNHQMLGQSVVSELYGAVCPCIAEFPTYRTDRLGWVKKLTSASSGCLETAILR